MLLTAGTGLLVNTTGVPTGTPPTTTTTTTIPPSSCYSGTTATVSSVSGNVITLTSAPPSCWTTGLAVVDTTTATDLTDQSGNNTLGSTITAISGNTITLSSVPSAPSNGDLLMAGACTAYTVNAACPPLYTTPSPSKTLWDNPAQFVGETYPNTGSQPRGSNGLVQPSLNNFDSGGATPLIETLATNSPQDSTWTVKEANNSNGINGFPAEGTWNYNQVVDTASTLTQSFEQTLPCCAISTGRNINYASLYGTNTNYTGWAMTEDYFTQPSDYVSGTNSGQDEEELSVQESYNSTGTIGTLQQSGGKSEPATSSFTGTPSTITFASLPYGFNVAVGDLVVDSTHSASIPSGDTISAVNSSTSTITLTSPLSASVTGDTILVSLGWNYGVSATDIGPIGAATPTSATGTNGSTTFTVPTTDFTTPSTSMGIIAVDDPVSDTTTSGNIPSGDYITAYNQTTGVITLHVALTGTITGDAISIGLLWFIQDGASNHNSDGTCPHTDPECGQLVMHPGCDWNDIPDVPNVSGTVPTKAIVGWLETHAAPQSSPLATGASAGQRHRQLPEPVVHRDADLRTGPSIADRGVGLGQLRLHRPRVLRVQSRPGLGSAPDQQRAVPAEPVQLHGPRVVTKGIV